MTSRRPVDCWHDTIGDHTLGDTMLDRLVYCSHRLTLTAGWSRRLWTPESPTDYPRIVGVPTRLIGISRKG
jgi:hypothetical protein